VYDKGRTGDILASAGRSTMAARWLADRLALDAVL